jgi:hypothetical protein
MPLTLSVALALVNERRERTTIKSSRCCAKAGPDGTKVEKELRRLLPLKTKAEYEPDDVAPGVATKALERAQRCVAVARTVAAGST